MLRWQRADTLKVLIMRFSPELRLPLNCCGWWFFGNHTHVTLLIIQYNTNYVRNDRTLSRHSWGGLRNSSQRISETHFENQEHVYFHVREQTAPKTRLWKQFTDSKYMWHNHLVWHNSYLLVLPQWVLLGRAGAVGQLRAAATRTV